MIKIVKYNNEDSWAIELDGQIILSSHNNKPFLTREKAVKFARYLKYVAKDDRFKNVDLKALEQGEVNHSEPSNSSACDCRTETANGGANKSADAEGLLQLSSGLKMILTTAQLGVLAALIQG